VAGASRRSQGFDPVRVRGDHPLCPVVSQCPELSDCVKVGIVESMCSAETAPDPSDEMLRVQGEIRSQAGPVSRVVAQGRPCPPSETPGGEAMGESRVTTLDLQELMTATAGFEPEPQPEARGPRPAARRSRGRHVRGACRADGPPRWA
jgi:hypothetical protein